MLRSWRNGSARASLLGFFDRVDEIPPNERVAAFDNDGTLWCEKPMYPQLAFFLNELQVAAVEQPALGDRPELRAMLDGDRAAMAQLGIERIAAAMLELFAGITPEEFNAKVVAFFEHHLHPRGVPYRSLRYQPMLELIEELRAREFDVYLVTAGGAEFVRAIGADFYGVKPEGVVGSQIDYEFQRDETGAPRLLRTTTVFGGPNEGSAKVPSLQRLLGRRPVVAAGNSPGDAEMLEYAMAYDGPSLALLLNHDDAEREFAYEGRAETFVAGETILDAATRLGWTVASMRNDWATVFPL